MIVLALDTSTELCSVAVMRDGVVLADRVSMTPNAHGESVAPLVEAVLRAAHVTAADLDLIAAGVGPGPFTGLRVGLATAAALGHALGIGVVGVGSLDALAHAMSGDVVAVTDARRREVYWARYVDGELTDGPHVATPDAVRELLVAARFEGVLAGPAADRVGGPWVVAYDVQPTGARVALLAIAGQTQPLRPLYLRAPDATVPGPRKPALR